MRYLSLVTPELSRSELEYRTQESIPEIKELVMTLAEQLMEQGRHEGIAQGRHEGIALGQRGLVCRQLELKFGTLSSDTRERIESASDIELQCFAERLLSAKSTDEVLKG